MTDGEKLIYAAVYATHWTQQSERVCIGLSRQTLEQVAVFAAGEATCAVQLFREIDAKSVGNDDWRMIEAMRATSPAAKETASTSDAADRIAP